MKAAIEAARLVVIVIVIVVAVAVVVVVIAAVVVVVVIAAAVVVIIAAAVVVVIAAAVVVVIIAAAVVVVITAAVVVVIAAAVVVVVVTGFGGIAAIAGARVVPCVTASFVSSSRFFLVENDTIFGVSQPEFPRLLCPVGPAGTGGNPAGGDQVGKLLTEGISHQRALAGLKVGGIHVLGRLVKTLDGSRKVDRTPLPPRDRQDLAVPTPDPNLTELHGLVPATGVRRGILLASPKYFNLVP